MINHVIVFVNNKTTSEDEKYGGWYTPETERADEPARAPTGSPRLVRE
jgi:hypothetical protein